jgi:DMAP1-binding Domain
MEKKDAAKDMKPEDIKLVDDNADTPPEGYTAAEWSDLSKEERDGILDGLNAPEEEEEPEPKLTKEEEEALAAVAGKTSEEIAKEEAETARLVEKAKNEGKTVDEIIAAETAEKATAADTVVTDKTDDELLSFKPVLTEDEIPKIPDKPKEKEEEIPKEIQAKFTALDEKFDAGDITQKEYNTQRDKINREIVKYNMDLNNTAKEEWQVAVADAETQKNDLLWKKEQIHFLNSRPEYLAAKAADAAGKVKSNALFGALTEMVKAITGDPASANLTGMQVLVKADKAVKEAFGIKPAEKKKEVKKNEKPDTKIPDVKTLGDLPNASTNMDGIDDSFAQIDKLQGEAYEAALERMSEPVRKAYLDRADRK